MLPPQFTNTQTAFLTWLARHPDKLFCDADSVYFGDGLLRTINAIQLERLESAGYIVWSTRLQTYGITRDGRSALNCTGFD